MQKSEELTVVLVESPSDWEPWAKAPFDTYPPIYQNHFEMIKNQNLE